MKKNIKKVSKAEYYLKRYLKVTPLSLALQRAVEAKFISSVDFIRPILDIGCGFGEFGAVFFEDQIEMGVDLNSKELTVAAKTNRYKNLLYADAKKLPFEDKSFASIISVSTLEHIDEVDRVFREAYRILKPDGCLAFTVVTDKWDKNICYGPLLKKIGFKKLGIFYTDMFNRVFKHKTLIGKNKWEEYVLRAGFKIEISKEIVSPRVAFFFDFFLFSAWTSQLLKFITGKRVVFRPKFMVDLLVKLFLKDIEEEKDGTNLFVVARKLVI
ncbi:MAG: class I SAM-dependent methyltransferase [Candidatus Levybacteria bacterium]|nr:class I SAM-dependent methyltransferase [Candidatus Levybacteria bacterium]